MTLINGSQHPCLVLRLHSFSTNSS